MKAESASEVQEIGRSVGDPALKPMTAATRGSSAWPHRMAVLLACATFSLLFIGALVTGKGAGLAVPDWPTTFGYNMFLYPWSKMVGSIFYEHSHRLVASGVGLITVALALILWFREQRNWVRWLGVSALVLVVSQGIVGGLRVVLVEQALAIVHACLAQAFFALTVSLVVFTSREWSDMSPPVGEAGRLARLCASTTALIYVQAIFGALVRHTGEWVEVHLFFAALVALHVLLVIIRVTRLAFDQRKLIQPAAALGLLLVAQLFLGAASYLGKFTAMLRLPAEAVLALTTTHLVMGALMLVMSLVLTLRAFRLSGSFRARTTPNVLTEQYSL
jgi:cytochrome c oxidase assembly protein subunit 15